MKVLISADVHVDDYADYNYTDRSRLRQFLTLADRFNELADQYDCKEIWLLGDTINRPNSRKYIESTAKSFLDTISKTRIVRYILGQHDISAKDQVHDYLDTLPSLLDNSNLVYMDRATLKIDNHVFGFMDFRPEQDLDWLQQLPEPVDHLDVLFGHYTKSTLFGQPIDESKFDLMIHGDIHNDQVIGKFVSVGNPIQHDLKSMPNGSCIIFNTEDCSWERIRVDEDHTRFLRIEYTPNKAIEGFDGPLQYYVYQPSIEVVESVDKNISGKDIDELTNNTFKEYNVLDIHSEVESQCESYGEIDFNFQINWIEIHGFRSIVDARIDLVNGDRVAVLGDNGSGKSSIIRAFQGVFMKNSNLKYFQSDFTDDMRITVCLTYQNKNFEITKGSTWRLVIDGQEQHYGGITEFEKDLPVKLPFLNFLDLFFINSDVNNLSSRFNPTRRIELISKFYRLDRLQAYYNTAMRLYQDLYKTLKEPNDSKIKLSGTLDLLTSRLEELSEFKDVSQDTLTAEIERLSKLRSDYQEYQLWKKDEQNLRTQLSEVETDIGKYSKKLEFDIDQGKIDLEDLRNQLAETNHAYEEAYKRSIQFENDLKEINSVTEQGKDYTNKLAQLVLNKCPLCGSALNSDKLEELRLEYTTKQTELREKWIALDAAILTHEKGYDSKDYYVKLLTDLKKKSGEQTRNIELLSNEISNYSSLKPQYDQLIARKNKLQNDLDALLAQNKAPVELPYNLGELESTANSRLAKYNEYQEDLRLYDKTKSEYATFESQVNEINQKLERYNTYIELTSMTGIIFENILTKLANKFTTKEVKYEVEAGVYRGSRYINFNAYYLVKNKYRVYEDCSDGQKIVCDADFLNKLFDVRVGLLVLDEFLSFLDDKNFPKAIELLTNMNVNTLLLSTHDNNLVKYTKRILLSLDSEGKSLIDIK